jgi:hypothetical protein
MAWEHHRFTILQVRTRLDGATILCSRLNPGRIKTSRRTSTTDSPDIHQEFTSTAITQLLAITMNLGTPLLPFKAGGNPEYSPSSSPSFPTNPSLNVLGRPFPVHSPFHTGYTAQNLHSPRYQPQSSSPSYFPQNCSNYPSSRISQSPRYSRMSSNHSPSYSGTPMDRNPKK